MKRYEYKIIAALVTILISMCCPKDTSGAPYPSPVPGRRGSASKHRGKVIHHTCTESNSYFFRSQCSDNGFMTVVKNRVLVQTTGLDMSHRDAEFVVETCSSRLESSSTSTSLSSVSPIVRYRHKKSRKYVCFTKRGKVRTVSKRQVDKRGLLCMFYQQPVEGDDVVQAHTYHRLQSVHNRRWHLGFDHRNSSLSMIKGTPHRGALPRRGKFYSPKKCDFKFFAGEFRTANSDGAEIWDGVFDLINKNNMVSNRNNMVSKAVDLNSMDVDTNDIDKIVKNNKVISSAQKEFLQQQKVLRRKSARYRNRIRHARHKKPRLNREKKNLLKRSKKPISKS